MNMLFVGGTFDGTIQEVSDLSERLYLLVNSKDILEGFDISNCDKAISWNVGQSETYILGNFKTETKTFYLYRHEDISFDLVVAKLMANYIRSTRKCNYPPAKKKH